MKKYLVIFSLMVIAAVSCSLTGNDKATAQTNENKAMENLTQVELKTSLGDIVVALYNETPKHRDNFIKLVGEGYYDGVLFHRVIKDFMVQTGDGNSKTATPGQMLGDGDVDYTIEAEFVYPKYFHKRGALAAARTGDQVNPERRSSGSQFYIVTGNVYQDPQLDMMEQRLGESRKQDLFRDLVMKNRDQIMSLQQANDTAAMMKLQQEFIAKVEADYAANPVKLTAEQRQAYSTVGGTPHLDGQYTVFGEVVSGMDVVDKIQNVKTGANDRPVEDVKIISARVIKK